MWQKKPTNPAYFQTQQWLWMFVLPDAQALVSAVGVLSDSLLHTYHVPSRLHLFLTGSLDIYTFCRHLK